MDILAAKQTVSVPEKLNGALSGNPATFTNRQSI